MMHYCITTEINKHLHFSNEIRLHIGGLAPDLTHPIYAPKAITHLVELNNKGKKRINYDLFIQKHRQYFNDSFFVGYLSHLVADYLWYDMMYCKFIRTLPDIERQGAIDKGYRDFRRLNKILLQHYQLTQIVNIPEINNVSIEGLYTEYIPVIVNQLNDDFKEEQMENNESLEIYNLESVLDYINLSIRKTISLLSTVWVS